MSGEEILVGYDGSADAAVALNWALDEAGRSGRPVRLAYVFEWLTVTGWIGPGVAPGVWPDEAARQQVDELVRKAAADAAAERPGLTVHGEVFDGPPALVLQERSADAGMLVLGSRGHGGFGGLLAGSTAVSVAAHAHCPVVVVRDGQAATSGPVVVGSDGSESALRALGFAVERAAQRDVPLRVLRAWEPPGDRWVPPDFDPEQVAASERAAAEAELAPWRESFPDVPVEIEAVPGSASALLVEASRSAQLVVVGSRGRGGLRGMLLGSVSQQLIQHSHCPVAVVRER
ncbi:universal stress protein [Micromonospora aurantiaca]|uniref:Universal stress protein n=2 Tax=Micromonospora aurantiaca (nom. illeg.) TaxID=47850 RepID=A0A1C6SU99_9ACTN|nr:MULTISPECIES: universal stress protein [Micromonospora]ADL45250.1 UspA domain-containing protein [Micromonospora aurantiaca ATCC 27029]AXH91373.1 universal stress protein [Micromonospora aurantiaca]KAB1108173.1 universal stress protein [Micromonospora aurantiaca]MDG4750230.1 universal stress protein [Micromonospora sp. WMMD718]OHX03475.1 universal stress protein UspA [Micromonospora sp. WMMB235]